MSTGCSRAVGTTRTGRLPGALWKARTSTSTTPAAPNRLAATGQLQLRVLVIHLAVLAANLTDVRRELAVRQVPQLTCTATNRSGACGASTKAGPRHGGTRLARLGQLGRRRRANPNARRVA